MRAAVTEVNRRLQVLADVLQRGSTVDAQVLEGDAQILTKRLNEELHILVLGRADGRQASVRLRLDCALPGDGRGVRRGAADGERPSDLTAPTRLDEGVLSLVVTPQEHPTHLVLQSSQNCT